MSENRLDAVQQEVNSILEERLGELLGRIEAVREVAIQIASAEHDIERHETLAEKVEADLVKATSTAQKLEVLQKVEGLRDAANRIRKQRDSLADDLAKVASALRGM
jgi:hypothetical protein